MNSKRIIYITSIIIVLILIVSGIYWFNSSKFQPDANDANPALKQLQITTSIYPIYEFTKEITGDLVNVTNITPTGVEPHEYEPNPQQVAQTYQRRLMIFNGNGIDPWAEKLAPDLQGKGIQVINMNQELQTDLITDNSNGGNSSDPHIWLDPILAQKEVDIIAQKIRQIDTKTPTQNTHTSV